MFLIPDKRSELKYCCYSFRSSHRRCCVRKGVLTNFAKFTGNICLPQKMPSACLLKNFTISTEKNTCVRVSFLTKLQCNFIKKETLTEVFSCKYCEIFKNSFFYRTPPVAASVEFLIVCDSCFKNSKILKIISEV